MKIFLSWSGVRSRYIADTLHQWLPNVIQAVRPFISSRDISKGKRGNVVIAENLEEANVGIICLTPESLSAPWILFESGALSKLKAAYVCTLLFELEPSDIEQPLSQFQHTKLTQYDVGSLMEAINSAFDEPILEKQRLVDSFDTWWPKLQKSLEAMPARPEHESLPAPRSEESKINELLELVRQQNDVIRRTRGLSSPKHHSGPYMPPTHFVPPSVTPVHIGVFRSAEGQRKLQEMLPYLTAIGLNSEIQIPVDILDEMFRSNIVLRTGDGRLLLSEMGQYILAHFPDFY